MKAVTQKINDKNPMGSILIFFSSLGIGYSLVSQFAYNKSKSEILVVMTCLLVVGIASKMRKQTEQ